MKKLKMQKKNRKQIKLQRKPFKSSEAAGLEKKRFIGRPLLTWCTTGSASGPPRGTLSTITWPGRASGRMNTICNKATPPPVGAAIGSGFRRPSSRLPGVPLACLLQQTLLDTRASHGTLNMAAKESRRREVGKNKDGECCGRLQAYHS